MDLNVVQLIAIYALPVILAITLHEAAHGYVAMRFGDNTAYAAGRVSLNPIRHIDPFGTVALPLALLALAKLFGGSGILFGWAKPVPVNFANLRHPKRDMLWVAAAGPVSNLLMALLWALTAKASLAYPDTYFALPLAVMGAAGVFVNVIFMVLNLLPLPPLDGGRMLMSLLPHQLAYRLSRVEPYGLVLMLVLLMFEGPRNLLWVPIAGVMWAIAAAFAVPVSELIRMAHAG